MLYPLHFRPVYKDYLWGGRRFESLRGPIAQPGPLAESWEVSCHPEGLSVIACGPLEGLTLLEAIGRFGAPLVGHEVLERNGGRFPLLVKFIDAAQSLSVQVHPDDAYALRHEGWSSGKNEAWYVVEADEGAELIAGLVPGTTREALAEALEAGRPEPLLRSVRVHPGDVIDIPAGRVHAIGAGLLLYEIQQNSDLTYRLHDFGRRDAAGRLRPLHVEKALDVIDFVDRSDAVVPACPPRPVRHADVRGDVHRRELLTNRYFQLEEWVIGVAASAAFETDGGRFHLVTAVEGDGRVLYSDENGTSAAVPVGVADTVLLPAALGRYVLEGPLKVLRSLPDAGS